MSNASFTAKATPRDLRLDVFRGLCLVMIFMNHIPGTVYEHLTSRNFGFSDAAEGFVFMSGMDALHGPRHDDAAGLGHPVLWRDVHGRGRDSGSQRLWHLSDPAACGPYRHAVPAVSDRLCEHSADVYGDVAGGTLPAMAGAALAVPDMGVVGAAVVLRGPVVLESAEFPLWRRLVL